MRQRVLSLPIPLPLLLAAGQLHMLQWVASRMDLLRPLRSDEALVAFVQRLEWMQDMDLDISLWLCMAAVAAGSGEVAIMGWLLSEFYGRGDDSGIKRGRLLPLSGKQATMHGQHA